MVDSKGQEPLVVMDNPRSYIREWLLAEFCCDQHRYIIQSEEWYQRQRTNNHVEYNLWTMILADQCWIPHFIDYTWFETLVTFTGKQYCGWGTTQYWVMGKETVFIPLCSLPKNRQHSVCRDVHLLISWVAGTDIDTCIQICSCLALKDPLVSQPTKLPRDWPTSNYPISKTRGKPIQVNGFLQA